MPFMVKTHVFDKSKEEEQLELEHNILTLSQTAPSNMKRMQD